MVFLNNPISWIYLLAIGYQYHYVLTKNMLKLALILISFSFSIEAVMGILDVASLAHGWNRCKRHISGLQTLITRPQEISAAERLSALLFPGPRSKTVTLLHTGRSPGNFKRGSCPGQIHGCSCISDTKCEQSSPKLDSPT